MLPSASGRLTDSLARTGSAQNVATGVHYHHPWTQWTQQQLTHGTFVDLQDKIRQDKRYYDYRDYNLKLGH